MKHSDTIAAISSPAIPSARIILRTSGPLSRRIAREFCADFEDEPRSAVHAQLQFNGMRVRAWIYTFHAPRSYTAEDLVEFHIPGNPLLARMLLDEIIRLGARHADPGEFTARAYFNGRLDLTAAEGVAAAIAAGSDAELSASRQLMAGELARRLTPIMEQIADTLALTEVGIDFVDEEVTFLPADEALDRISSAQSNLEKLRSESARFERLSHEPHFVLAGRPNAGKSTLLNALAGAPRAVVSPVAGTTRDAISATVPLDRGIVRITDAAGVDATPPDATDISPQAHIARQMQARSMSAIQSADFVLLLHDITDPRLPLELPRVADLLVLTKLDLAPSEIRSGESSAPRAPSLSVSAQTGENLGLLRKRLGELAFGASTSSPALALNARHLQCIAAAAESLARAADAARHNLGTELVALELRTALDSLGQILGQITPDDVLTRVFSAFCIGK